ncbi:hypothetical protein JHK85_051810 [Glycine max]|nr:hypothetical protein JHK85_051810 [Glycine max]
MRRYRGGMLYAALPLHMQRGCFRIRTHDPQVTKAQLYRCTRARPLAFCDIEPIYTFEGTYDINTLVTGREITGFASFKPVAQKSRL